MSKGLAVIAAVVLVIMGIAYVTGKPDGQQPGGTTVQSDPSRANPSAGSSSVR